MHGVKLSPTQLRVLRAIAKGDITWRWAGTTTRLRWWLSEHDYRTLTSAERRGLERLSEEAAVKKRHGWHSGVGGYELTPKGRAALEHADA